MLPLKPETVKKDIGQWILSVLVLAALLIVFVGLVWLIAFAIREGATVVAATLAGLATIGGAAAVRQIERQKAIEEVRRDRLGPIYEQLTGVQAGHNIPQRKIEKMIPEFFRKGLLYASPDLLKAYREWIKGLPDDDSQEWPREVHRANALRYEAFVKAMRKDLGVSNRGLKEGDLGRTVINDYDEFYGVTAEPLTPPEPDDEPRVTGREPSDRV
jgi:hypothetical protein